MTNGPDSLWWAAGHIDGDGCYALQGQKAENPAVTVTKAMRGIAAAEKLQALFGGHLRLHGKGTGNRQVTKRWSIFGQEAISMCIRLEPYSVLKTGQCQLLSKFPAPVRIRPVPDNVIKQRLDIKARLREEKQSEHTVVAECPPHPWWAGFFDADGSVRIRNRNSFRVSMSQKYRSILDAAMQAFGGAVHQNALGWWSWEASGKSATAFVTAIAPFSIEKREQLTAVLAMDGSDDTARKISATLRGLKGNQICQELSGPAVVALAGLSARAGLHHPAARQVRLKKRAQARARAIHHRSGSPDPKALV